MLIELTVPIIVFTAIIVGLAGIVLAARGRLEPSGIVTIDVNEQRVVDVAAGRRLLFALADAGIYLPAACGGRGTCGECRVTVKAGGGPPLPTESVHISEMEAARGMRLACMTKIREDMRIDVPPSVLDVRRYECTVATNRQIGTFLKELTLELPDNERLDFVAGQYVLLEAPPHRLAFSDFDVDAKYRNDWSASKLFTLESEVSEPVVRAYSLANPPQQSDRLTIVVRLATPPAGAPPGRMSSYLFSLRAGDGLQVSGPFGEFRAREGVGEMVFIAGGAGIGPIRSIILDQLARGTSRKMSLWFGSRDCNDLCYREEFEHAADTHDNFEFHAALSSPRPDDEWTGATGFIHRVVYEQYLKTHPAPADVEYYLCGPPVMSAAVMQVLDELGVERGSIFFDDFGT